MLDNPRFTGVSELCRVAVFSKMVLGVMSIYLALLELSSPEVMGVDGSSLSRFGLLGLVMVGIDACVVAVGFSAPMIGRRRIDLKRSSFLTVLERFCMDSDLVIPLKLFTVADFMKRRGAVRLNFDGEGDCVGIWLVWLALTARASEACVGVVTELRIDRDRESVGVASLEFRVWGEFWFSSVRARFAGVFSKDSG